MIIEPGYNRSLVGTLSDAESALLQCDTPDAGCTPEQRDLLISLRAEIRAEAKAQCMHAFSIFAAEGHGGHEIYEELLVHPDE